MTVLSWILMALSIVGSELVARKIRLGWLLWVVSNVGWVVVYVAAGLAPSAVLFGVYLLQSLRGLWAWRPSRRNGPAEEDTLLPGKRAVFRPQGWKPRPLTPRPEIDPPPQRVPAGMVAARDGTLFRGYQPKATDPAFVGDPPSGEGNAGVRKI